MTEAEVKGLEESCPLSVGDWIHFLNARSQNLASLLLGMMVIIVSIFAVATTSYVGVVSRSYLTMSIASSVE